MTIKEIIEALAGLSEKERDEVFRAFCRACHVPIKKLDWSARNFCAECSEDPDDDR